MASPQRLYLVAGRGLVKVGRTRADRGSSRLRDHAAAGLDVLLALWRVDDEYRLAALAEMEVAAALRSRFPPARAQDLPNGWTEAVHARGEQVAEAMAVARVVIEESVPTARLEAWEMLPD